jgi:NTE family protein
MTRRKLNLALQGGGSHGAYAWGVLDRLLEEEDVQLHGVSGTSAGAMNAVVLAHGYRTGKRPGARKALRAFWEEISALGCLINPFKPNPLDESRQNWNLDSTISYQMLELMVRVFSPYQFNPFNLNPLRQLLSHFVDWTVLNAGGDIPVFITATSVRTGGPRVFRCQRRRGAGFGLHPVLLPDRRDRWRALLGRRLYGKSEHLAADLLHAA